AVGLLIGGRQKSEILFVFSALVSFIFILSSVHFTHARYVVPLLPPLLVLVGKMLADSINATSIFVRYVGRVTAFTVLVFSALYTVAGNLQFTFDSRKLAAAWIERNAPAGSKIEVTSYGPTLPDGRFTIVERPKLRDLSDALATLEEAPIYQLLQPIYLDYRLFAEDVGLCEYRRPHYRGWYDARMDRNDEIARTFDLSIHGLEKRAPDFVIASSFYYDRYEDDNNSVEGEMFDRLFAGDSVYRQVAEIHYQFLPWRDPPLEFINPTVRIFQRADTLAQPSRSPDLAPPKE
ncbi:MAG: hypothetical protein ACREX3_24915, partial [Gammaproteobacteria bacterium]